MLLLRFLCLGLICLTLTACDVERPADTACAAPSDVFGFLPLTVAQSTSETATTDFFVESMLEAVRERPRGLVTVNVLSLSSGGQYGAFGAGFLRGWSENTRTPRPQFDLVTGVSAGGLLAPVAFAGPEFDPILDTYRGLAEADVYRQYHPLVIPFRSSVTSTAPMAQLLRTQLTDDLIARVAERHREDGAQLLVAAANLDTTENRVFNLGQVASAPGAVGSRRNCMTEIMLASAAVPGLFPPRNIDGDLYADGGLRDHVFFRSVESARVEVARRTGRDLRVEATIIVNGALTPPTTAVSDSLIGYFTRSAEILADEVLRDSIAEAVAFAEDRPGWRIKGVYSQVDLIAAGCDPDQASGTIDPCVTTALFDSGRALAAAAPIDWQNADELLEKAGEL